MKISNPNYSTLLLEANINKKRRQRIGMACGIVSGVGLAPITLGATIAASAYSCRSFDVAAQKLLMLEEEWKRRGQPKLRSRLVRDRVLPGIIGAATVGLGPLVSEAFTTPGSNPFKRRSSGGGRGGYVSLEPSRIDRRPSNRPALARGVSGDARTSRSRSLRSAMKSPLHRSPGYSEIRTQNRHSGRGAISGHGRSNDDRYLAEETFVSGEDRSYGRDHGYSSRVQQSSRSQSHRRHRSGL